MEALPPLWQWHCRSDSKPRISRCRDFGHLRLPRKNWTRFLPTGLRPSGVQSFAVRRGSNGLSSAVKFPAELWRRQRRVFEQTRRLGKIRVNPGIAYCLRRLYPLMQQLARSHWIGHIKANRQNHCIQGEADDNESFLFSPSRQSLDAMAQGLRKLEGHGVSTAVIRSFRPMSTTSYRLPYLPET